MGSSALDTRDVLRLTDIVKRHCPDRLDLVRGIGKASLTEDEREELREAVASELVRVGLTDDGEPNAVGLELETLIDKLRYA